MASVVGVDVGGTFTDVVAWDKDTNKVGIAKVLSTPTDQSIGVISGLEETGVPLSEVEFIVHGTTVATNAIIERKGAKTVLITTKGFRDVIELKRRDRPTLYGLHCSWEPLIPRFRRFEVEERVSAQGEVLKEVSEDEIRAIVKRIEGEGVECIVIAFMNAYASPLNERKAAEILRSCWNGYIVVASEVVPEYREFERMSTAVTNAYVQPKIDIYLSSLEKKLKEKGFTKDVSIVHSSGGIMSLEVARQFPVRTLLSGPSAGVAAATFLGSAAGYSNIISCDMGGTSFDCALIKDGQFGIIGYKELRYSVPLLVPQIDMITIGAGGGSIAWVDRGGILRVGPQSAGADPGPVCYGKGGQEPTVTDANLVLGRIDKDHPIGKEGEIVLDIELATKAIREKIADALGLSVGEAAKAIVGVVNASMAGNIRLVSIARGHDPREFALMMFGGGGPLHGDALMKELEIPTAVIPLHPGLFCAMGCMAIPFQYSFGRTVNKLLADIGMEDMQTVLLEQERRCRELLKPKEQFIQRTEVSYEADMHFRRQTHFVSVPLPSATVAREEVTRLFEICYRKERGELAERVPVNIMNLRTTVTGYRFPVDLSQLVPSEPGLSLEEAKRGTSKTYFDGEDIDCNIFERMRIPVGAVIPGPAIVAELDSTTFIGPDSMARVDNLGNLIITRRQK